MAFEKQIEKLSASISAKEEQIEKFKREVKAFNDLADSENRDLTEEEEVEINKILDEQVPELQANLEKEIESLEKYEQRAAFAEGGSRKHDPQRVIDLEKERNKIVIPAQARKHANLKAFKGPDAEADAYASGRWLMATLGEDQNSAQWCRDHGIATIKNAMSTGDNTLGGYTVPTPMEVSIIALREMYGVFRQNAMVETMSSDVKTISRPIGGITASFVGEGESGTYSDSQWKNIELVCRKLMALAKMSVELSADSVISVADQVARDVAYAFAKKEDECGFLGDGTATYGGIVGLKNKLLATSTYTAATGNTAFSTLDLADFEGMVGQLPQYAEANAKWYISKVGYWASMARLLDAAGGNTKTDLSGAPQLQFLGYPVVISQVLNTTTAAQTSTDGLCYFGDLNMAATLASRTGMSMSTSNEVLFTSDQIAIKGTQRFGINVHEYGAATGDAGPILMLSTPGS